MNPKLKVLLIGGSSGIGKSHLARQLSEHYKIPLTEVDDIRITLQQVLDQKTHPDLFTFLNNPNYLDNMNESEYVQKLFSVSVIVEKSLQALISKHIVCNEPIIFEGDSITPELLINRKQLPTNEQEGIESIFLYDDIEEIKQRQLKRNRHGEAETESFKNASYSHAYSEELRKRAEEYGFTTIKVSPLETLYERVLDVLSKKQKPHSL